MISFITRPHNLTAHKRRLNDDSSERSDAVPRHVIDQKFLNKLILTKISATLNQDPTADLTVLLSDVSTSYPSKRRKTTETPTSNRKGEIPVASTLGQLVTSLFSGRVSDNTERDEKSTTIPPPPKLEILYPLAPAALAAIGLSDGSSETEIESALIQFPRTLAQGEILHKRHVHSYIINNNPWRKGIHRSYA